MSLLDRVADKGDGCWLWPSVNASLGYGYVSVGGRVTTAHRAVYEQEVGPIPAGLHIDHLCHDPSTCVGGRTCIHRRCVRPGHLEPVTQQENIRRGGAGAYLARRTHCPYGHAYDDANTYRHKGGRSCRECVRRRGREYGDRLRRAAGKPTRRRAARATI